MIHAEEGVVELLLPQKGGLQKNQLHDFAKKTVRIPGLSVVCAFLILAGCNCTSWTVFFLILLFFLGKEGISPHPHLC